DLHGLGVHAGRRRADRRLGADPERRRRPDDARAAVRVRRSRGARAALRLRDADREAAAAGPLEAPRVRPHPRGVRRPGHARARYPRQRLLRRLRLPAGAAGDRVRALSYSSSWSSTSSFGADFGWVFGIPPAQKSASRAKSATIPRAAWRASSRALL